MSDKAAIERLAKLALIPRFARADHREFITSDGRHSLLDSLPRKERRRLAKGAKEISRNYISVMKVIESDRAGFPIDGLISSYGIEYTNRYASSGIYTQPMSFNYIEPFCIIDFLPESIAPYAKPLKSHNHLFSLSDFFEFDTNPATPTFDISYLLELPDAMVYHFTPSGLIGDITFKSHTDREFCVSGFSIVRRGTSIHWVLLGGEAFSEADWNELATNSPSHEINDGVPAAKKLFMQSLIESNGRSAGSPVPLEGTTSTHRSILAGEIDLVSGKILGRFFAAEYQHSFLTFCDDPDAFAHIISPVDKQHYIDSMTNRIDSLGVLWAVSESLIRLPQYMSASINYHGQGESGETRRTSLSPKNSSSGRFENVYIPSIRRSEQDSTDLSFSPVKYDVETEGYWKRLGFDEYGTDLRGNQVKGKTWVEGDVSWRDSGNSIKKIYIKNTISSARAKKEEMLQKAAQISDPRNNPSRGVLYVLRCNFMIEEVYKIGWTSGTAADRAKELSRATGVPKAFDVVAVWENRSARELEANVHAVLDQYRLNDRREFFQIDLAEIKRVVDFEVDRLKSLKDKT